MHIQCTKKMLDFLKPEITEMNTDNDLYAWHAHYIVRGGKKLFVFMNDLTKFSVVLYPVKKIKLKEIHRWFHDSLFDALTSVDIPEYDIENYLENAPKAFTFNKTKNRTLVSRLNKAIEVADIYCQEAGVLDDELHQIFASNFVNNILISEDNGKDYYEPKDRMKAYLDLL